MTSSLFLLCAVGFFVNFQPSEPFLTQFLLENKNLSEADLDTYVCNAEPSVLCLASILRFGGVCRYVWPVDTYGSFLFLLPVGLLAEKIGYLKVILLGVLAREATRMILLFADSVTWVCPCAR